MDLIQRNPYRTLGIYSDASTKEIHKQLAKVKAFSRVGKQTKLETDFDFLDEITRDLDVINEAVNRIEQVKNKVLYALFWFINHNHIDATALDYLFKNEVSKSIEIWQRIIESSGNAVKTKSLSAYLNLSTIYLALGFKNNKIDLLLKGIRMKGSILSSDLFMHFVREIGGENIVLNPDVVSKELSNEILSNIKKAEIDIEFQEILDTFSSFPGETVAELKKKYTEKPLQSIEDEISIAASKRKKNEAIAAQAGLHLYKSTKENLSFLVQTLGKNNIEVRTLANNLANEILQCGIDYYNYYLDDTSNDPGDQALRLAKIAKNICPPGATMNRIEENMEVIQEWVDDKEERKKFNRLKNEFAKITNALDRFNRAATSFDSVNTLLSSTSTPLINIKNALGVSDEQYLNISSTVAGSAQGMVVEIVNEAQKDEFDYTHSRLLQKAKEAKRIMGQLVHFDVFSDLKNRMRTNLQTISNIVNTLIIETNRPSYTPRPSYSKNTGCLVSAFILIGLGAAIIFSIL